MDLAAFEARVAQMMEEIRDALALIEEAAGREFRPELLQLSAAYARLVPALRDYLTGAQMRRPLPRMLAKRLLELLPGVEAVSVEALRLEVRPSPEDVRRLIEDAGSVH